MEINQSTAIQYAVFIGLTVAATVALHMAFRTAHWQQRELTRRAIGIVTVMGLFALTVLLAGTADAVTWLMIVGGFVVAGGAKWVCQWFDNTRRAAVIERLGRDDEGAD